MTYDNRLLSYSSTCCLLVSRRLCFMSPLEGLDLHDGVATILNIAHHHHRIELWRTWVTSKQSNNLVQKQHVLLTTCWWGLSPWWPQGVRKGNPIMCLEGEPDISKQHHQDLRRVFDALETIGRKEERNHNLRGRETLTQIFKKNPFWAEYKIFFFFR